jgi:hypothetical protein
MRTDIAFDAGDGTTLRGRLCVPDGGDGPPDRRHGPRVLAVKEQTLEDLAEVFVSHGPACVVYDHRNLGASDGTPRQDIDPVARRRHRRVGRVRPARFAVLEQLRKQTLLVPRPRFQQLLPRPELGHCAPGAADRDRRGPALLPGSRARTDLDPAAAFAAGNAALELLAATLGAITTPSRAVTRDGVRLRRGRPGRRSPTSRTAGASATRRTSAGRSGQSTARHRAACDAAP